MVDNPSCTSLGFASVIVPTSSDLSYILNTTLSTFANILNLAHFYVFIDSCASLIF